MEIEKEHDKLKPTSAPFDESKLTPPQREALALVKMQGKKIHISREDLVADIDPEAIEDLIAVVMEIRKRPSKLRDLG